MHGIVTVFGKKNDTRVRSIWEDLERAFGLRGIYKTPHPRFSYQIATEYEVPGLEA